MEQQELPNAQSPQPNNAKVFVILGWIFTVLTIFLGFIMFIPALIMGILAIVKGSKANGIWIIVVSVILLIISLVVGTIVAGMIMSNISPSLQP